MILYVIKGQQFSQPGARFGYKKKFKILMRPLQVSASRKLAGFFAELLFGRLLWQKGGGVRFKNTIFVVSRSDMYIVSIQQILCSALSRGFEPCSATVMLSVSLARYVFKKKKAGYAPAMPIRQSDKQWVGGDLFVRQIYYRLKCQIPLPLFFYTLHRLCPKWIASLRSQRRRTLCTNCKGARCAPTPKSRRCTLSVFARSNATKQSNDVHPLYVLTRR